MENKKFHTIIIGGGAAGIMAAISSKREHPERTVLIIDRTFALGRKILVCGAGRCNITNVNLSRNVDNHYYGEPEFIKSIFNQFGFDNIKEFFEELGIPLYIERKTEVGKMFPTTNRADSVTELLLDELKRLGVEIQLNTNVNQVITNGGKFQLDCSFQEDEEVKQLNYECEKLVISAGGKTYPALGSNGSGYELAKELGHEVVEPVPSALPLEAKSQLSQKLQGIRLDAGITSFIEGKKIKTRIENLLFTQYGLSGPVILNISREISIHLNRHRGVDVEIEIDFLPNMELEELKKELMVRWEKRPDQKVAISLYGLLPNKVADVISGLLGFSTEMKVNDLVDEDKRKLFEALKSWRVKVTGTRGWNEAEFTAGGISTVEVNEETLESEKVPGLYFCGEILNVDGDVGGFNLSWAWSSGNVAGKQ